MVQTIVYSRHLLNDNRHRVRRNLHQRTSLERVFLGSLIDSVSMLCWVLVSNERFHFCTLVANRVVALNTFFLVAQAGRSQFINQSAGNRGCVSRTGLRGQGGCKFFVCLGVLQQREITRWRGSTARKFGHQVKNFAWLARPRSSTGNFRAPPEKSSKWSWPRRRRSESVACSGR